MSPRAQQARRGAGAASWKISGPKGGDKGGDGRPSPLPRHPRAGGDLMRPVAPCPRERQPRGRRAAVWRWASAQSGSSLANIDLCDEFNKWRAATANSLGKNKVMILFRFPRRLLSCLGSFINRKKIARQKMNKQYVLAPQPTMKRLADIDGPDFYPTPSWATRALLSQETFQGEIWECACGDGAMSSVLEEGGNKVISSDLFDRGFGSHGIDFTTSDLTSDNIVTNPPYNLAEDFVHKGVVSAKNKFALLLRLAFLESAKRKHSIFDVYPPARSYARKLVMA